MFEELYILIVNEGMSDTALQDIAQMMDDIQSWLTVCPRLARWYKTSSVNNALNPGLRLYVHTFRTYTH